MVPDLNTMLTPPCFTAGTAVMNSTKRANRTYILFLSDTFFRTLLLTWLCVQAAAVQEVGSKDDVDVTEEQQDVSSFPRSGTHVQTSASGKLLVQVDHREVTEIQLSVSKMIERNSMYLRSRTHSEPLI